METLDGVVLYWFISVGLLIGMIFGWIIGSEGISVTGNVIWGAIGAVLMGLIGSIMGFGDGILFAALGTLILLFLVNVFHQHHEEELMSGTHSGFLKRKYPD